MTKDLVNAYVDVQLKWFKEVQKAHTARRAGDTLTFGKDDNYVYIGTSWYIIRIPKIFWVLNDENLPSLYGTGYRAFPKMPDCYNNLADACTVRASDTGLRKKVGTVSQATIHSESCDYIINEAFLKMLSGFDVNGFLATGKERTALAIYLNDEVSAIVLPIHG